MVKKLFFFPCRHFNPRKENPKMVDHYRSISFYNIFYRFSLNFASEVCCFLQEASIPDRSFTDNILIAREVLSKHVYNGNRK